MPYSIYPVFDRADWNEFSGGSAWVNVPQEPYADPRFPFEHKEGDTCIIVENEEMMGTFGVIEEIIWESGAPTPAYVKVRIRDS